MATIKAVGVDEYVAKLERLTTLSETKDFVGKAIYDGAAVVKGGFLQQLNALPVGQKYAKDGEKLTTITSVQKRGLQDGFGIAKMRKDGDSYNVKLGFDGYNGQKTSKWPHGQPNSMIARAIVSGTSFREKNDFIGRAVRQTRDPAIKAMQKNLEKQINKIMR